MTYNSAIHHRRSVRLKNYDYSQNGAYFITLCTYNRKNIFGSIDSGKMNLNSLGMIAQEEWMKSFHIRKELTMDEYVIMPNHLHGIVFLCHTSNKHYRSFGKAFGANNTSISSFIAGFKSAVTKRINIMRDTPNGFVWQRNYHEHIIRCDKSLTKIREYTVNNPVTWQEDSLFMDHEITRSISI